MPDISKANSQEREIEISFLFSIVKSKFLFFIISFIIFLAIFLAFTFNQPAEYYASFPITITKPASEYVVSDLRAASKFSKTELVSNLSFTEDMINNLNFIQVTGVNNEEIRSSAIINISAKKAEYLKIISDKLINASVSNPKLKNVLAIKEKSLKGLVKKTEEQLKDLNKIKQGLIKTKFADYTNEKFSFVEENKLIKINTELKHEIIDLKDVVICSAQFFEPLYPINKSKKLPVFFSLIGAFLLAVLLTLIYRKKI